VVMGSIKEQTRRCMSNLSDRLQGAGTSLERVVWANWSLKDPSDFDEFNMEWVRWFPREAPLGQLTIMPPLQRRAGFGVSLGVIATLDVLVDELGTGWEPSLPEVIGEEPTGWESSSPEA
jgi:enamine deaminase RidA (YjgF/YER057c/UK114 family)